MIDRIRTRRAALAAQLAQAQQQYDQLESALKELDRQLCAMQGGLQELDALIADVGLVEVAPERVGAAMGHPAPGKAIHSGANDGDEESTRKTGKKQTDGHDNAPS
jgi:transposase